MRTVYVTLLLLFFTGRMFSQSGIGINTDGSQPDNSAILDVKSANSGMLIPRMTQTEIELIVNPADGLIVYSTTDKKIYIFNNTATLWKEIAFGTGTITPPFTCGQTISDSRDNKTYNTVQIGTQCWMAQNLNVGNRINGSEHQTNNSIIEKFCFSDLEPNCDIYGGLYQWAEMVQYLNGAGNNTSWSPVPTGNVTGICPIGWHLPSDTEWTVLATFLGGDGIVGGKMKETGLAHWASPNYGANNSSGFTGLPGGFNLLGSFQYLTYYGEFWTTLESNGSYAWHKELYYYSKNLRTYSQLKSEGFSVRCMKD